MPLEYELVSRIVRRLQDLGLVVVQVDHANQQILVSYRLDERDVGTNGNMSTVREAGYR